MRNRRSHSNPGRAQFLAATDPRHQFQSHWACEAEQLHQSPDQARPQFPAKLTLQLSLYLGHTGRSLDERVNRSHVFAVDPRGDGEGRIRRSGAVDADHRKHSDPAG